MSVIPCEQNAHLSEQINEFAEILKTEAHTLGTHGLSEADFYEGGLFRGAIERIRGQFSATMREKREFAQHVFSYMQDHDYIADWQDAGDANRHDYLITLPDGRISAVEMKGCLDGNNTNIFERPPNANEFVLWSVCTNPGADPRHNVWSGIHTRLSCEIIEGQKPVDGLIVWDWICGTIGRPCPKLVPGGARRTAVGPYQLAPPCIYLFPATIPSVRNNPSPAPHTIESVGLLLAMHQCFKGQDDELNSVRFSVSYKGSEVVRRTTIERGGVIQRESEETPIRRK